MNAEQLTLMLEEIKKDPQKAEMLKSRLAEAAPGNAAKTFAAALRETGYDISEEDLKACLERQEAARKEKTETAARDVQTLSDTELTQVTGGECIANQIFKLKCYFTFQNWENCTMTDGCDNTLIYYDDYYCAKHNRFDTHVEYCTYNYTMCTSNTS